MTNSEILELELSLFATGKFSSRKAAKKEALKKVKIIEANKKAANDKCKEPPQDNNFAEF